MHAPQRFYLLDVLRGSAAIAVLIFHWQFWGNDSNRLEPASGFPLYRALGEASLTFFYQCGAAAVGLFFTLSGFIFYWLFRNAINEQRVGAWQFFVDRFSRLYPLHLATLIVTAIGQHFYALMNHGVGWTSPANSFSNFLKQLVVVPLWTRHRDIEFNLPVWSLVVEVLAYVLFFVAARRARPAMFVTILMIALGSLANWYSTDIGYGLTSFFMGGLVYLTFDRLEDSRIERPLFIVVGVSWAFAIFFGTGLLNLAATPIAFLDHTYAVYVLFPSTLLYVAMVEARRGPTAAGWAWLGDATYSMYLLGFPLMLALALAIRASGHSFNSIQSPLALLVFLAVIIPIALASHRYFERPTQDWIRRRLFRSAPGRDAARSALAKDRSCV
jgi:peptidoglycan/LPS O-acetylase OafA/YrhL